MALQKSAMVEHTMRSFVTRHWLLTAIILVAVAESLPAQTKAQGIAFDHKLTIEKCGGCHQRDKDVMMTDFLYPRDSRNLGTEHQARLHAGVILKPAERREMVKYLSSNNGLAPEEQDTRIGK
jgi:hypothetical protein